MSGRWFRPNFHVESFSRSIIQESHINHRSELSGDHFHEWAMICPNFHVESFLRSIIQESHINHRSELSGDHFHEWAMISSKISCREFLEIYNTREPHHSQKWAIWRPFSWVGVEFLEIYNQEIFMLSGDHFLRRRRFRDFHVESFWGLTREPHQTQKWVIWRRFSWVGDDFVQNFMSRVSRDL